MQSKTNVDNVLVKISCSSTNWKGDEQAWRGEGLSMHSVLLYKKTISSPHMMCEILHQRGWNEALGRKPISG